MCFYLQSSVAGTSAEERKGRRTGSERRPGRLTCRDPSARDAESEDRDSAWTCTGRSTPRLFPRQPPNLAPSPPPLKSG